MKKLITVMVIIMMAAGFLAVGNTRAEAMNNESAALLTAGLVLFGIPVVQAIAREAVYPAQVYGHAYPAPDRYAYPPERYIERTKIIYVEPRHERIYSHRHKHKHHERDCRHGWDRHEDRRGREDSHRDSRRHNYDD